MTTNLPSLPRAIFNPTLYRRILTLWFEGHNLSATAPTTATSAKWFALGSYEEKATFDAACLSVGQAALEHLAPERYPLPKWRGFEADRADASALSAPLRELIVSDGVGLTSSGVKGWESAGDGLGRAEVALALILLLDQFPRDVFRDVKSLGRIYEHYDRLARALAYGIVGKGADADVKGVEASGFMKGRPPLRLWFYMPLEHSEWLDDHYMMREKLEETKQATDEEGREYTQSTVEFELRHAAVLERFGRYVHRNEALGRESSKEEREYLEGGGETFGVTNEKAASS